jgi:phosphoribosylformylglycinamidine synthase
MISFFSTIDGNEVFAIGCDQVLNPLDIEKLSWALGEASMLDVDKVEGIFIGTRSTMITPWSTNAVEIMQNMGINKVSRIEVYQKADQYTTDFDPMLKMKYTGLDQDIFTINIKPEDVKYITDIDTYNKTQGLSLSAEEVTYLQQLSDKLGRLLTDSEVFGFSQVNSEHCRHKIFNGQFIIDGEAQEDSLFGLIKKTSKANPNHIVSAYKDNVAFVKGPVVNNFSPEKPNEPSYYTKREWESVLSLKAETHNFPTTVEPFNGAATGSGGEIRDRLAGGIGSIPLAGTAVYMTAYPRLDRSHEWSKAINERNWLYQTPLEILIKASNGASDFGNKFGQPLICGSLHTFEHEEAGILKAYDKVIMQAGGIGFAKASQAQKGIAKEGDAVVILGGDNYRIGMGGAAVSSSDTGAFDKGIELNAVQRSNPEMQKRAANTIVALVESEGNPIISIHDHGAGGHLNCLSELVEPKGGVIEIDQLPIGDPTLSDMEIIGNESQERMGLIIDKKDLSLLQAVADRERSPMYVVGEVSGDGSFIFKSDRKASKPIDLHLKDMFGSSPKLVLEDQTWNTDYNEISTSDDKIFEYLHNVLSLEGVGCKDWLTNKVDRCVGGKVAVQQCCGPLQLPLNNCGVMALDFYSTNGVATSIGHAAIPSMIDAEVGTRLAIVEALSNIVFAPLSDGLRSISLSANWMWPCKNEGEDARLYRAVSAASEFAIGLGINIPTGKDSLSMAQKYPNQTVLAPGTVIISAVAHTHDFTKVITPDLKDQVSKIYYLPWSDESYALGGSALAQTLNRIGVEVSDTASTSYIKAVFEAVQVCLNDNLILAGHDISSGGLITALLEMCFPQQKMGLHLDLNVLGETNTTSKLFSEQPGLVLQATEDIEGVLIGKDITFYILGNVVESKQVMIKDQDQNLDLKIDHYRDVWYKTSYLLDQHQTSNGLAEDRYANYKNQPLHYSFPEGFSGKLPEIIIKERPKAAIIREKGSNSEREMANALYQSGFDVMDIHMTDLISGRADFSDVRFLGAVGGFSNSDVLGSAKGWAGAFKYNQKAQKALKDFFDREDTLSVGICNGCQLFMELDLLYPDHEKGGRLTYNKSHKHESAFTSVDVLRNESVMLQSLEGARLGVWISHGEGRFNLPMDESAYRIAAKYGYDAYPSNPNGSDYNAAMVYSHNGRHLATMPHIERSFFAWNWPYYDTQRKTDLVSPWHLAFENARKWCY